MSVTITGHDPAAAAWPVVAKIKGMSSTPSGATATGGTIVAVLGDGSDATFVTEPNPNNYFRGTCDSITLPAGARLFFCAAVVRARLQAGNTKYKDFVMMIGDHSKGPGTLNDLPASDIHHQLTNGFLNYQTKQTLINSIGKPIGQIDLQKGIYVLFGLNMVYGVLSSSCVVAEAYMRYQYDMPPTSTITYPPASATLSDTNAPLISWDYFDDFHGQGKYQLNIQDHTTHVKVYDSGLVVSQDTFHQVATNLPNGTYDINLRVYQGWTGPGGDFPSLNLATSTFTVNVLSLAAPRVDIVDNPSNLQYATIAVYPDINLLDFDTSTADRGILTWNGSTQLSGCTIDRATTPVRDGVASIKVTTTATSGYLSARLAGVTCKPGDVFNAMAYINPLAVAGATAQMAVEWLDATGAFLSESVGSSSGLSTNTYNQRFITNAVAPANAAFVQARIKWTVTTIGNVIYVDDVGIWYANGVVRYNKSINPNGETSAANWVQNGSHPPTITQDAAQFHSGTKSIKLVFPGPIAFGDGTKQTLTGLVVGQSYVASAWVRVQSGSPSIAIATDITLGSSSTTVDAWGRLSTTFIATSTTHSIFVAYFNSAAGGGTVWIDDILVEPTTILQDYFDGNTAGAAWDGTTNLSSSTLVGTLVPWSRGGFFESTPNLLSYADSTIEDDSNIWIADASLSGSTVTRDNTNFAHGSAFSLMLTKSTAGTNDIAANLGQSYFLPLAALPLLNPKAVYSVISTISRTVQMRVNWWKADFTASAITPVSIVSTSTGTSWFYNVSGAPIVPADAAYFSVSLRVVGVATTTEKHWFDGIALYDAQPGQQGFWSGFYPDTDTDIAPYLFVEYQDFGETIWNPLQTTLLDSTLAQVVINDYTVSAGLGRKYRATLLQQERGITLNSPTSAPTGFATKTFKGVWMNTDDDPVGSSYQFTWDGHGKTTELNAQPQLVDVDGRLYPFPQFGEQLAGSQAVTVMLENNNDVHAMQVFALKKGTVVYRDGRGRNWRGVMGPVTFTDVPRVGVQQASFTLTLAGDQP